MICDIHVIYVCDGVDPVVNICAVIHQWERRSYSPHRASARDEGGASVTKPEVGHLADKVPARLAIGGPAWSMSSRGCRTNRLNSWRSESPRAS